MASGKPLFPELAEMLKHALGDLIDRSEGDFLDLFADDGAMEFPYALPGWPSRVAGRDNLRAYLEPLAAMFQIDSFSAPIVHRTQDRNVVIIEYDAAGHVLKGGEVFTQTYVEVMTLRDGKIVTYRDYWNPMVVQSLSQ